jgi:RNA polymerase sigma-70 factor, ECF subfamily
MNTNALPKSAPPTDNVLCLENLKHLDEAAWEMLLALYGGQLHRDILTSLRRRGLPDSEAEDIQQETWITAIQKIDDFEGGEKLYYWLRVISLNHIRSLRRKQRSTTSLDEIEAEYESNGKTLDSFLYIHHLSTPGVEGEIEHQQQLEHVGKALLKMNLQDRDMFLKRYLWQKKPLNLAQEYPSMSAHTIAQRLLRARRRIRLWLEVTPAYI